MSVDELEAEKDKILEEIDGLEESCDSLPLCEEDDGLGRGRSLHRQRRPAETLPGYALQPP